MDVKEKKYCPGCKADKHVDEFGKNASQSDGRASRCRTCCSRDQKHWRAENRDKNKRMHRDKRLRAKYGMTTEDKRRMLAAQGDRCASCSNTEHGSVGYEPDDISGWCVDHDHVSGHVRGIVCRPCNLAIGLARDSACRLRSMADYIDGGRQTFVPGLFTAW